MHNSKERRKGMVREETSTIGSAQTDLVRRYHLPLGFADEINDGIIEEILLGALEGVTETDGVVLPRSMHNSKERRKGMVREETSTIASTNRLRRYHLPLGFADGVNEGLVEGKLVYCDGGKVGASVGL